MNRLRDFFIAALALVVVSALFSCVGSGGSGNNDAGDDDSVDDDDDGGYDCYNPPNEPPDGSYLPIGVWYHWLGATGDEAHDREYYASSFADLAAHGIDMVIANFVFGTNRVWLLDEVGKHGIKVIMGVPEMTALIMQPYPISRAAADQLAEELAAPIRDMAALFGYYIANEPDINDIIPENLAIARQAFEKADPLHPSFSCFALLNEMQTYFDAISPEVLPPACTHCIG